MKADAYDDSNQLEHDMTSQPKRQALEPEMECLLSDTASTYSHVSYATTQEEPRRQSCSQRTITRITFAPINWTSPQWTPTSIISTVFKYRPFEAPLATRYTLFSRRFLRLQPMLTRRDVLQGHDPVYWPLVFSG